jgi:hypothetical protein
MKHSLSVQVWIRCVLGVAVILGVVAIATGWETSFIIRRYSQSPRAPDRPFPSRGAGFSYSKRRRISACPC